MITRRTVLAGAAALPVLSLPTFATTGSTDLGPYVQRFMLDALVTSNELEVALQTQEAWQRAGETNKWWPVCWVRNRDLVTIGESAHHLFQYSLAHDGMSLNDTIEDVYLFHSGVVSLAAYLPKVGDVDDPSTWQKFGKVRRWIPARSDKRIMAGNPGDWHHFYLRFFNYGISGKTNEEALALVSDEEWRFYALNKPRMGSYARSARAT